ncbi:MAG: fructosamine kinase family protein [Verrucomicrobiota bacterium]
MSAATGTPFQLASQSPLSGGCINNAYQLIGKDGCSYFAKTNRLAFKTHFEEEFDALQELAATQTIKVPTPIAVGETDTESFLILEYIAPGSPSKTGWAQMGQQLAALHAKAMHHYGWHRNNAIGATPQPNSQYDNWIDFYRDQRLQPQFKLAQRNGLRLPQAEALLENLSAFFETYTPRPSLLHGDLWSGNAGFTAKGEPFIFDPCSYYGDRETDLAFTEFFGGYRSDFYSSYNETLPLDSGYKTRKHLYNLYHCLNHFNLFGSGYAAQSQNMLAQLLSEIR